MPRAAVPPAPSRLRAGVGSSPHDALLREAEAQRALAELFPHLQPGALRAIQDLFPSARGVGATADGAANEASAH